MHHAAGQYFFPSCSRWLFLDTRSSVTHKELASQNNSACSHCWADSWATHGHILPLTKAKRSRPKSIRWGWECSWGWEGSIPQYWLTGSAPAVFSLSCGEQSRESPSTAPLLTHLHHSVQLLLPARAALTLQGRFSPSPSQQHDPAAFCL